MTSRNLCHSGKFSTAPPPPLPPKKCARTPMNFSRISGYGEAKQVAKCNLAFQLHLQFQEHFARYVFENYNARDTEKTWVIAKNVSVLSLFPMEV